MKGSIIVGGKTIEIESPAERWREVIKAGSLDSAKNIAGAIDDDFKKRPLYDDEQKLRDIIKEEKGI
jgi:hypothetical protein